MIRVFVILLFISGGAYAGEFSQSKVQPVKTPCVVKNNTISFSEIKKEYKIYESKAQSVKAIECHKIEIQGLTFFSSQFSNVIEASSGPKKILTYEVALYDQKSKSLHTVRSEVLDQYDLAVDAPAADLSNTMKALWGQSQKDKRVMLKLTQLEKNSKPFSFLLKLNSKKTWFENVF
jgi:hypothetical protein